MSDYVDKAELLRRLHKSSTRLKALLGRLTAAQALERNAIGDWSVKDVLAHVIAHEQWALQELQYAQRGQHLSVDHSQNDPFNAQAVADSQLLTFDKLFRKWKQSYQPVVAAMEALSDTDFEPSSKMVRALGDSIEGTLGNNTYEHYDGHADEIEAWLRQVG